ncbi:MAG: hypothetical protein R3B09_04970 [Nannocystaceae bacterium]
MSQRTGSLAAAKVIGRRAASALIRSKQPLHAGLASRIASAPSPSGSTSGGSLAAAAATSASPIHGGRVVEGGGSRQSAMNWWRRLPGSSSALRSTSSKGIV